MLRPLLHFLVIGALLFAANRVRTDFVRDEGPLGTIELDGATLERLAGEAVAQTGRTPGERELAARAALWADEEILYREARRIGIDRVDPVVRSRLVRNMRFLAEPDDPRSDDELYAAALELAMDRSDIVVRRRLVQQMRFLLEATAPRAAPSDDQLRAYVASRPERYRIPERVRLSHIYLSRDRRGRSLVDDAQALLERVRREGTSPKAGRELGDPFLHPSELGLQSEAQLARQLGATFARGAIALEPGSWQGPVESAYGMHLVWPHERQPAREPELDTVRRSALSSLQADRNAEVLEARLATLRERYAVDLSAAGDPRS
ncbi:MAG: peptidyl-prolyl cis-trans isomerase [Myxococcota bacterium]|nr:peptidyl-prolyl cis-trans isomerase [Myxococcota bacterium]